MVKLEVIWCFGHTSRRFHHITHEEKNELLLLQRTFCFCLHFVIIELKERKGSMKCTGSVLHIKYRKHRLDMDQPRRWWTLCLSNYWLSFKLFGEKHSTYFWTQSITALNTERLGNTCNDKRY